MHFEKSQSAVSGLRLCTISQPAAQSHSLECFSEKLEVSIRDLFDFGGPEQSIEKERMMAQLQAIARDLDEATLAIALDQIRVLSDRRAE